MNVCIYRYIHTLQLCILLQKFSSSATPKFFTAYGDQTAITVFTEARYFSLCRDRLFQSTSSHPIT